ncbi:MAG: tetratricopeptide repeat protein [Anaerovoracaceae bacterium]
MTIEEAKQIEKEFDRNQVPTGEEKFMYTEAMDFLINETGDSYYMMELGGWYYEQQDFRLAEKYYEMAAGCGNTEAYLCLGYIWYYGRIGEPDYKKAFEYYSRAAEQGNINAKYKLADMYKNGYYVEKDYDRYKEIIEELYPEVEDAEYLSEPKPEIFTRLAEIRTEEGRRAEAAELYLVAEDFLAQRIKYNPFFGNLTIMKGIIRDLYRLLDFDWYDINLYDLYYVLAAPSKLTIEYVDEQGNKTSAEVSSVYEDGGITVQFDGQWFRTADDFFAKAQLAGHRLTEIYDKVYIYEAEAQYE